MGSAGGEAVPGRRRDARRVAVGRRTKAGARDQGDRPPLVGPVVRGARLPGPQPVPYRWYASDEPEGERLLAAAGVEPSDAAGGRSRRTGQSWSRPRRPSSPTRSGCRRYPRRTSTTWSSSAAARPGWARPSTRASEGLRTVLVERRRPAARPARASRIENYLGFPDGVSGAPADRPGPPAGGQVRRRDAHHPRRRRAERRAASARGVRSTTATHGRARTASIIATGVSYRRARRARRRRAGRPRRVLRLGVDRGGGLRRTRTSTSSAAPTRPGRRPCSSPASRESVTSGARRRRSSGPCRATSSSRSRRSSNIKVRTCTEVVGGDGDDHLEALTLRDVHTGETEKVDAGHLFVFIGAAPRTDWLDGVRRPRRARVRAHRPGPGRRRAAPARLAAGAGPVPPGDERARRVRRPATCAPTR